MKKIYLLFLSMVLLFSSCINNDENTTERDLSVGSIVVVDGLDYKVVNNSFKTQNSSRGASTPELEVVISKTEEETKKFAKKIFGDNILLLRVAGQVQIPAGTSDLYENAKKYVIPSIIPDGMSEKDFFFEKENQQNCFYYDNYIVYSDDNIQSKIGRIKTSWNSNYHREFEVNGEKIDMKELLKNYNPEYIRTVIPEEFYTYDKENCMECNITTDGSYIKFEKYPIKNTCYYSKEQSRSPFPAATMYINYDKNYQWYSKEFRLCQTFRSEAKANTDLYLKINKNDELYRYSFYCNREIIKSGDIVFDSEGNFAIDNITLDEISGYYNSSIMKNIPISFVKNGDEIDFGEEVYKWGTKWRDEIIKANSSVAAIYNKQ